MLKGIRPGEVLSRLLVEIKSACDMSKIESVFQLRFSNFFQLKDLPRGKYIVQLKSTTPSSTHKFKSQIIEVDLEKNAQIHVGHLRYSVKGGSSQTGINSCTGIPPNCRSFSDCSLSQHSQTKRQLPSFYGNTDTRFYATAKKKHGS